MGNIKSARGKSSSSENDEATLDISELVREENSQNQVVIYSKSYCPYCSATKTLFQQLKSSSDDDGEHPPLQIKIIELDRVKNGSKIQDELYRLTGQSTVPNVFVNNQHVGGNDDTQAAYRSGQLVRLLGWSTQK